MAEKNGPKIPYNAWTAMTPEQRMKRAATEPFDDWATRAERQNKVWREVEPPAPDLTLTGDMVSGSPYQNAAKRASDILYRKYNPNPERPISAEEAAFLQAWQNRPVGK